MDIKVRFLPGDKVWRMVDNKPTLLEIYSLEIVKNNFVNKDLGGKFKTKYLARDYVIYEDHHLFDSREKLIASL